MWWYMQAGQICLVTIRQNMLVMHSGVTAQPDGDGEALLLMPYGEHDC